MGEPKSDFTKLGPLWSQVVAKPSGTIYKCTLSWIDAGEEPGLDFTGCEHRCEHHLRTHPPVGPEGPSPLRVNLLVAPPKKSSGNAPGRLAEAWSALAGRGEATEASLARDEFAGPECYG